jgi:hypothetical protein
MELTGGNFRVEVHDIVANDEHAVGLHTAHAEREGRTLQDNNTLVSTSATGRSPRSGSIGRTPRRRRAIRLAQPSGALAGSPSST